MEIWQGLLIAMVFFYGGWLFCSLMTIAGRDDERREYMEYIMSLRNRIKELEDILYGEGRKDG